MEREALEIIYACKKYRHYLLGYKIIFHTDHGALKYLVNKPDLSGRIARWILLLQEFDYEVQVKKGKSNSNADFLSRIRGEEAEESIPAEFPDEEIYVCFADNKVTDYEDIVQYLDTQQYPEGLTREEKAVFQQKVAPYTCIKGVLFKMGLDERLRRCLEKREINQVISAMHCEEAG
jgi:hypothetical protein